MKTNLPRHKFFLKFVIALLGLNAFLKFSEAQPFSIVVNGPSDICGTNNTYLSITPSGGTSFRWFHYLAYPFGQPYTTGPVFYYPPTGSWMCEVTTSNGVYTTSPIPIRTNQPYITASYGGTDCSSAYASLSEQYTAVNGYNVYNSYQWKKDGNNISGATNYSYTATSSGSYNCVVTLSCGSGTSNSISVVINNPIPSNTSITANGSTSFCDGGSVTLTVPNTSGWSYQWKRDANIISGATTYSYLATQAGTYTCVITNVCNTVTTSGVAVAILTAPVASINAGSATTFCAGSSVTLTANTGSYNFQWKNNANVISGATNQNYVATAIGDYSCDVGNNCGTTTSNVISVIVNSPPSSSEATIAAGGPTWFCSGGSVVLTVASAGLSYQWKNAGSAIAGSTQQSFTASANGAYTCDVSNTCGTTGSNSITVTSSSGPTTSEAMISAGGATTFCSGGNVVLTVVTGGLLYQWKKGNNNISGATHQSYTATKNGTYKCVVTNSCGNTTSNSISVSVIAAPTVSISQGTCSGGAILLTCTSNPNLGVTYQWQKGANLLSGATSSTYSATMNGTYKCTVTIVAGGCSKTSTGSKVTITCRSAEMINAAAIHVYPNPTSDYFNINTSQLDEQSEICIYDLTGRLVESHKINGDEMKIGETLTNGVYFLKIASNNEVDHVIKLVKNF